MSGDEIHVSSDLLDVLMAPLPTDMFGAEGVRNGQDYGASIVVFGIVWDAVTTNGNYPLGIWTDSFFDPADMSEYMPEIGSKGGHGAVIDGNFHAGSRLSILKWSDFAVVSRPDPSKPDDIYVTFLYKDTTAGNYKIYRWANNAKSGLARTAHVDDLTQDEIDMLGFDPATTPYDEGWLDRLQAEGKLVGNGPVTCFVLTGRGAMKDTWQGETGKGRPMTRSVINDRFWKPSIPVWAWEFNKPDQPDTWLNAPPDGKTVKWKDDGTHQWRRQHGLSQVVEGTQRDAPEYQEKVLLDDGTRVEVYVLPINAKGGNPLNNATYAVVRGGGYVIDFKGENYHTVNGRGSLRPWGLWNAKVAKRTIIRVVPPLWSEDNSDDAGVKTELSRSTLSWQQGPVQLSIEYKLQEWQQQFCQLLNTELSGLRDLMSGAVTRVDPVDLTKDLQDLASVFGSLYTEKVMVKVKVDVPDPTATRSGPGKRKRQARPSTKCPDCGRNLPLPGHLDSCPRHPADSQPAPPIPPGQLDWDGDVTDGPGTKIKSPLTPELDPDATKQVEQDQEQDVPTVALPHVQAVDWTDIEGRGFPAVSWAPTEVGPNGEHGVIRVAWGSDASERYPTLVQAFDRLCVNYGVADNDAGVRQVVEDALWGAVVRLLAGKFGHVSGQSTSGTFPKDGELQGISTTQDHPVVVTGLTVALYGIQDLERFAVSILSQVLGAAIADA